MGRLKDKGMDRHKGTRTDKRTDKQMDECINGQMDRKRQMNRQTDGSQTFKWTG